MNMGGKGAVLSSLKGKMQALRDELDGVRDEYDQKCKECEALKADKNQVGFVFTLLTCIHASYVVTWICHCLTNLLSSTIAPGDHSITKRTWRNYSDRIVNHL